MNIKTLLLIPAIFILGFGIWLFFWPLIECWYAISWEPLLSNSWKLFSWILGFFIMLGGSFLGIKAVI